jgi:hypothetical protein
MPTRPLEFFKPLPRHRIETTAIDPVIAVIEGVASLNDPAHLRTHVEWLARREHYAEAARALETRIVHRVRISDRNIVENIVSNDPISTRLLRVGRTFVLMDDAGRVIPRFGPADFLAFAKKKDIARVALAALGFGESAAGIVALSEQPAWWPTVERERLALALHAVVVLRHGGRLVWRFEARP